MSDKRNLYAKPACYTDAQWEDWSTNCHYRPSSLDWACTDCMPSFKAKMLNAGKCSWPCVVFFRFEDGSIEGRRMSVNGGNRPPRPGNIPPFPIKVVTE